MIHKQEYLYCWDCKTRQQMVALRKGIFKVVVYKCPMCGHINRKEVQPENV